MIHYTGILEILLYFYFSINRLILKNNYLPSDYMGTVFSIENNSQPLFSTNYYQFKKKMYFILVVPTKYF